VVAVGVHGGIGIEEVLGHRRHRPARVVRAAKDRNYLRGNRR
jgi:hypothetical protein